MSLLLASLDGSHSAMIQALHDFPTRQCGASPPPSLYLPGTAALHPAEAFAASILETGRARPVHLGTLIEPGDRPLQERAERCVLDHRRIRQVWVEGGAEDHVLYVGGAERRGELLHVAQGPHSSFPSAKPGGLNIEFDSTLGFPGRHRPRRKEVGGFDLAALIETKPLDAEMIADWLVCYGKDLYGPVLRRQVQAAWDLCFAWLAEAGCFSLAFGGLMRIGEVLQATRGSLVLPEDMLFSQHFVLVSIREPKTRNRGPRHQAAKIEAQDLVQVIGMAFGGLRKDQKLWPMSPQTLRKRLDQVLRRVGAAPGPKGARPIDLGSFRAGGAIFLLQQTEDSELVRRRGRWASAKIMEIYLQEVSAAIYLPSLPREQKQKVAQVASGFKGILQQACLWTRQGIERNIWYRLWPEAERLKAEEELRKLQAQLPELEGAVQEATAQLDDAKRAVAAEAAAQSAANATQDSQDNASAGPSPADEVQEAFESQVKATEAEAKEAAKEAEAKPVVSEYSKWMDGAEKVLEEASEAKPDISEYSKWMDGAEKVLAEADDFDEVLKDAPDFPDDDNEPASPASSPSPSASRSAGSGFWEQVKRKWGEKWQNFRNWAFGSRSPAERALDKAENRQEAAQKELKTARVRVEELEKKLKSTTEEWELPYSGLDGRCIEKSIGEYKYKICFFDDAKQDSTSVGRWKGWEAPGLATFDAGQYCPGGPERSLKVKFQCGSKEELLDVSEPSRCTYEAQLKHPAACTAELLRALEAAGPRRPLDEL
ncbi:PSL4 [Symbiodinium sp. CCMP2456]|nr:PSL4 [Symbiodinium sp. CCMP2456]